MQLWWTGIPGRGNRKCRCPEAGRCLAGWRNREEASALIPECETQRLHLAPQALQPQVSPHSPPQRELVRPAPGWGWGRGLAACFSHRRVD